MKELSRNQIGAYTVVLYDWMDYPRGKPARNVKCYDRDGNEIWVIESLGSDPNCGSDCWVGIDTGEYKIIAFSWSGLRCLIDTKSGRILSRDETR